MDLTRFAFWGEKKESKYLAGWRIETQSGYWKTCAEVIAVVWEGDLVTLIQVVKGGDGIK